MDFYIGAIATFGFNFAPVNWLMCNGQLLPIADYQALYTLLGTTYGGDGVTTFGIPDLRSRVPIGTGQGPGLSNYVLGAKAGTEVTSLSVNNLAAHTHPVTGSATFAASTSGSASTPAGNYFGNSPGATPYASTTNAKMGAPTAGAIQQSSSQGGGQPFDIHSPFQGVNYCICAFGIYPVHP
jgi:microcystin-dependent protein